MGTDHLIGRLSILLSAICALAQNRHEMIAGRVNDSTEANMISFKFTQKGLLMMASRKRNVRLNLSFANNSSPVLVMLALCVMLATQSLFAQTGRANISGTVTDSQEAVVSGARVTATNTATGVVTPTATNISGVYQLIAGRKNWRRSAVISSRTVAVSPAAQPASDERLIPMAGDAAKGKEGRAKLRLREGHRIHAAALASADFVSARAGRTDRQQCL